MSTFAQLVFELCQHLLLSRLDDAATWSTWVCIWPTFAVDGVATVTDVCDALDAVLSPAEFDAL